MDSVQYMNFASGEVIPFTILQDDARLDQNTNIDQLIHQINDNLISSAFRIYVLYADESINYEIPQEDIKLGGSYSENYQNGQRRSLSFSLYNNSGKYTPTINQL